MNNNSNETPYIREYTIYQIQTLFKILIYGHNLLKKTSYTVDKLKSEGNQSSRKFMESKKSEKQLVSVIQKVGKEIFYIIKHPERIKIREIPIEGILDERKLIFKMNKDNEYKIKNLRSMFFELKNKFHLSNGYIPEEFSTKHLDAKIKIHEKTIKNLIELRYKLSGKKTHISKKKKRSFLEALFDCPTLIEEHDNFDEINENLMMESKKIVKNEKKKKESYRRAVNSFSTLLDNLS